MRVSWLLLGVLSLASCTPKPTSGPSPQPASASALPAATGPRAPGVPPMPRDIPGYQVIDTSVFEQPNSGLMYRYSGANGFVPDIYLYPMRPRGSLCTGDCREQAAKDELASFRELIPALIQRGYYDSMVVVDERAAPVPAGSWLGTGRRAKLRWVSRGVTKESHFVVYAGQEQLLKLRASFPVGSVSDEQLESFLQELVARTPAPYSCAKGASTADMTVVSVATARPAVRVAAVLDSVLRTSPRVIDFRAPDQGNWRGAPTFTWPAGSASEGWHGAVSPGYILFASAAPAGDSTKVQIGAQVLCRPEGGSNDNVETTLSLFAAVWTVTDLTKALGDSTP